MIGWIAQAAGIGADWRGLAYAQLLTQAEADQAQRAETFLQQIRIRLHLLAGRREDRLLFDYQESLARELALAASKTKRASEVLMQRYYQNAKLVTQLNTIILQNLAGTIFPTPGKPAVFSINPRFQMTRELLDVTSEDVFETRTAGDSRKLPADAAALGTQGDDSAHAQSPLARASADRPEFPRRPGESLHVSAIVQAETRPGA